MQMKFEDDIVASNVSEMLIRALNTAIGGQSLSDRQRDAIVGEMDSAIQAISAKAITTDEDTAMIEKLESVVLNLRVMGASSKPGGSRISTSTL